eukprot:1825471-Rhodomonas_salina.1
MRSKGEDKDEEKRRRGGGGGGAGEDESRGWGPWNMQARGAMAERSLPGKSFPLSISSMVFSSVCGRGRETGGCVEGGGESK